MERDYVLPKGPVDWQFDSNHLLGSRFIAYQEDPSNEIKIMFEKSFLPQAERRIDDHPSGIRRILEFQEDGNEAQLQVVVSEDETKGNRMLTLYDTRGEDFSGSLHAGKSGIVFLAKYGKQGLEGLGLIRHNGFVPDLIKVDFTDRESPYLQLRNREEVAINRESEGGNIDFVHDGMHLHVDEEGGYFEIDSPIYLTERLRFFFPKDLAVEELFKKHSRPDDLEWVNVIDLLPFGAEVVQKAP